MAAPLGSAFWGNAETKIWLHAGLTGETVTAMVVKGLVERDAGGALSLTDRGRAVLRAMLPDL